MVLHEGDIEAVRPVEFDIRAYQFLVSGRTPPPSLLMRTDSTEDRLLRLPASSSRHFSCNRPFFGTANNNRSFKLSTNKDMVDSAPKEDFDIVSPGTELGLLGKEGRRTVEAASGWEGIDVSESTANRLSPFRLPAPFEVMGVGRDMRNVCGVE